MITIPNDYPVQPIEPNDPSAIAPATCGTCGLTWDDGKVTSMTPAPSARCPFEAFHEDDDEDDECPILVEVDGPPSGEHIGACTCGRPIYRSRMAGTIYHATDDGWTPRHVDDDGTIHPATPNP